MNDRDLDALIRDVLHVEPPADQVARLEQYWRARRAARRRRPLRAAALAACLLLAAGAAFWLATRATVNDAPRQVALDSPRRSGLSATPSKEEKREASVTVAESAPKPTAGPSRNAQPESDSTPPAGLAARPATAYEALMFRISVAQAEKSRPLVAVPSMETRLAELENRLGFSGLAEAARYSADAALRMAIIHRLLTADEDAAMRGYLSLVADEGTRRAALAAADRLEHPPVDALFKLLRDEQESIRTSAAIALGRINGPEVTATLINLVTSDDQAPTEAWIALLACRGESADSFLAGASQHPRMLNQVNHARIFWQTVQ